MLTVLSGEPSQLGYQHGTKHRQALGRIYRHVDEICLQRYGKLLHQLFQDPLFGHMVDRLPFDIQEEAISIAEAGDVSVDLIYFMVLIEDYEMVALEHSLACSTIVTPSFVGRTLDWWECVRGLMPIYQQVFRYHQPNKQPFLSVSWIGCPVVYTALGQVFVSVHACSPYRLDHNGIPIAVLARMVVEQATNVDEALEVIRSHRAAAVYNMVVADQNRAAAITITPEKQSIRWLCKGVITNHPVSSGDISELLDWLSNGKPRYLDVGLLLVSLLREAKLRVQNRGGCSLQKMEAMLRSFLVSFNWKAVTVTGAVWPRLERALYVAFNDRTPVTHGTFHRFTLDA